MIAKPTMPSTRSTPSTPRPFRIWPGIVIVVVQWLVGFGLSLVVPWTRAYAAFAGVIGVVAILVWWTTFSRAQGRDRWLPPVALVVGIGVIAVGGDPSLVGFALVAYTLPVICLVFVAGAFGTRHVGARHRPVALAATLGLVVGGWLLVRSDGISGDFVASFTWRWAETAEERLLAAATMDRRAGATTHETGSPAVATLAAPSPAAWPGFRGAGRDGHVADLRIDPDWSRAAPVELWRRPVGPGWSSFAVDVDQLYTQEQRGDDELVTAYRLATGEPVWRHADPVRFWEANGGAGPRATPTVHGDRVYAFGATGRLNVLDAADGRLVWSRDAAVDTDRSVPVWGFASSPLVVDDVGDDVGLVIVNTGVLIAYDLATGMPRWQGPAGDEPGGVLDVTYYSSPQRVTLAGVSQIVQLSPAGVTGLDRVTGTALWTHPWAGIVQCGNGAARCYGKRPTDSWFPLGRARRIQESCSLRCASPTPGPQTAHAIRGGSIRYR